MVVFDGYQSSSAIIYHNSLSLFKEFDNENSYFFVKTNLTIHENGRVCLNLWHFELKIIPALESFDMFG